MQKGPEFQGFQGFVQLVGALRAPGGCPWDRAQTHATLVPYVIEEAYEVAEAIEGRNDQKCCEELGDLLLQVVLHAQLARERGAFTIEDVLAGIIHKMLRRHPHVFGGERVADAEGVLHNWERWKREEQAELAGTSVAAGKLPVSKVLSSIPKALPALYRAEQVQKKAARFGFDWQGVAGAWEKVKEETREVEALLGPVQEGSKGSDTQGLARELGDLFFALVNVTRKLDLDAETLTRQATQKFLTRFSQLEEEVEANGKKVEELDLPALDQVWDLIKQREKV